MKEKEALMSDGEPVYALHPFPVDANAAHSAAAGYTAAGAYYNAQTETSRCAVNPFGVRVGDVLFTYVGSLREAETKCKAQCHRHVRYTYVNNTLTGMYDGEGGRAYAPEGVQFAGIADTEVAAHRRGDAHVTDADLLVRSRSSGKVRLRNNSGVTISINDVLMMSLPPAEGDRGEPPTSGIWGTCVKPIITACSAAHLTDLLKHTRAYAELDELSTAIADAKSRMMAFEIFGHGGAELDEVRTAYDVARGAYAEAMVRGLIEVQRRIVGRALDTARAGEVFWALITPQ